MAILISSHEVFGGPSTPLPQENYSQNELNETSPLIDKLNAKTSGDNIEVFVLGWRPTNCYNTQEILVQPVEQELTRIIIRLKESALPNGQSCAQKMIPMKLKVADLQKNQKSSYKIQVLGNKGWHQLDLSHLIPEGLQ